MTKVREPGGLFIQFLWIYHYGNIYLQQFIKGAWHHSSVPSFSTIPLPERSPYPPLRMPRHKHGHLYKVIYRQVWQVNAINYPELACHYKGLRFKVLQAWDTTCMCGSWVGASVPLPFLPFQHTYLCSRLWWWHQTLPDQLCPRAWASYHVP